MKFSRLLLLSAVLCGSVAGILGVRAAAQEETNPTTWPDSADDSTPRVRPAVAHKPKAKVSAAADERQPKKKTQKARSVPVSAHTTPQVPK